MRSVTVIENHQAIGAVALCEWTGIGLGAMGRVGGDTYARQIQLLLLGYRPGTTAPGEPTRCIFPNIQARQSGDPRWAATLDTLRPPPEHDQSLHEWRREAPLRPVVFTPPAGFDGDTVQLHLSHRVVQRLVGRCGGKSDATPLSHARWR